MHRLWSGLVAIALAACTDPAPTTGGTSRVSQLDVLLQAPPTFDVLVVVDDSPAMAAYPSPPASPR